MTTGRRLLDQCMPSNYKQGTLYPTRDRYGEDPKAYGNRRAKKAGHVRKAGQNKLRKQLQKDMMEELYNEQDI